jgi:Flp pilus assembly pilin Flp
MSVLHYLRSHFDSDDDGQATTEYALILLAAAVIAVLVITWATAGGGAGRIGDLFDSVFDGVLDKATSTPE